MLSLRLRILRRRLRRWRVLLLPPAGNEPDYDYDDECVGCNDTHHYFGEGGSDDDDAYHHYYYDYYNYYYYDDYYYYYNLLLTTY